MKGHASFWNPASANFLAKLALRPYQPGYISRAMLRDMLKDDGIFLECLAQYWMPSYHRHRLLSLQKVYHHLQSR